MNIYKTAYILLISVLIFSSIVFAAPAWKKETTNTEPEVIIINQTVPAQAEEGINWEMIGVILTLVVLIGGFLISKLRKGASSKYLKEINYIYNSNKKDSKLCESKLINLKDKIENEFTKGKITEQSYDILDRKIESYLGEIRKGIISNRFELSKKDKDVIDKALEDGVITSEERRQISKLDLSNLSKDKKDQLMKVLDQWKKKVKK